LAKSLTHKAKRKFWNTQFVLPTLSKINQKQKKMISVFNFNINMKLSSRDRLDAYYIYAEIGLMWVRIPVEPFGFFSDKTIQMRKIDVGICKIYSVCHLTIELVKNHRFYVVNA
jgi:hypothetical protein